ncbi:MAG: VanW family protein [bacterium]
MKIIATLISVVVAVGISTTGALAATSFVFAGRVPPGVSLSSLPLSGVPTRNVAAIMQTYEDSLLQSTVTLVLGETAVEITLADLGVSLDKTATIQAINNIALPAILVGQGSVAPVLSFDEQNQRLKLEREFAELVTPPQNATLQFNSSGQLIAIPSHSGDGIDLNTLQLAIAHVVQTQNWSTPININIITTPAQIQDDELESARILADQILKEGIQFIFQDKTFVMKPYTVRRLLTFVEQVDPDNPDNHILGLKLDPAGLNDYLINTITPAIDQPAVNARFELIDGKVSQFTLPQTGQALDPSRTASHLAAQLARFASTVPLAVDVATPQITDNTDINNLGLTSLLAVGESDFSGSPKNRTHNIKVGAQRFHGLLIPPGEEFSFNRYLGPVSKIAGFLPELVIKNNVTTPELGGGLCQVSTTTFRAALNAGLKITSRRSHAYIVRYYGTPGLDATIYPPSTDLRFVNNTPGYILIQTKVDGTKLTFDFWGTPDGRHTEVADPVIYDRGSDGSAKAYVNQKVTMGQEAIIDDTFYSRYKSPKLFPKVLAAGEANMPSSSPSPSPSI